MFIKNKLCDFILKTYSSLLFNIHSVNYCFNVKKDIDNRINIIIILYRESSWNPILQLTSFSLDYLNLQNRSSYKNLIVLLLSQILLMDKYVVIGSPLILLITCTFLITNGVHIKLHPIHGSASQKIESISNGTLNKVINQSKLTQQLLKVGITAISMDKVLEAYQQEFTTNQV